VIHRLQPAGAPHGLQVAVAEGADDMRRGLATRELDRLIAALLPDRSIVRLAGGRPAVGGRDDLPVGLDVECVDPELDALAIDPDLFGPRDFAFLQEQPKTARVEHFYRLWTLKEARLKRFGRSLVDSALPDILTDDGRIGTDMSTTWLTTASKRYCVGLCWGAAVAPSPVLASANCW
jgi:hypothetical protein